MNKLLEFILQDSQLVRDIKEVEQRKIFEKTEVPLEARINTVNAVFDLKIELFYQNIIGRTDWSLALCREYVINELSRYGDIEAAMRFDAKYRFLQVLYEMMPPKEPQFQPAKL